MIKKRKSGNGYYILIYYNKNVKQIFFKQRNLIFFVQLLFYSIKYEEISVIKD